MNSAMRFPLAVMAAGMTLAMFFAPPAGAADCSNPQGTGAARACAKAAEGPVELRRYIERTEAIYNLSYYDFSARAAVHAKVAHESLGDEYAGMQASATP